MYLFGLWMSSLQDKRTSWCSVDDRSLDKLRSLHRHGNDTAREPLDQPWRGAALPVGRLRSPMEARNSAVSTAVEQWLMILNHGLATREHRLVSLMTEANVNLVDSQKTATHVCSRMEQTLCR